MSKFRRCACLIAVAAGALVGTAPGQETNPGAAERRARRQPTTGLVEGGERKLDVVYKKVAGRELRLDLYYPPTENAENAAPHPVVFYTHGGGWAAGSRQGIMKASFKAVFGALLEHGFAVASVEYRLTRPESGVTMRDCVIDSKDAMRYLAKHADTLKLDPQRFYVMGDSAGGQIAQVLLLSSPESLPGDAELAQVSYKMRAGVSWYGPSDFEKTDLFNHDDRANFKDRFEARILGSAPRDAGKRERYREVSPVNYLSKESPPLLMIQGDKDTTIPVKHALYMQQKASEAGAPVEIEIVENSAHNWRSVDADIKPSREAIIERTVRFLVDHLPEE